MSYRPGDFIYEGKAKRIFSVKDRNDLLWQEFKNNLTAFNGVKKSSFDSKGEMNRDISSAIFRFLKNHGIKSHYIGHQDKNIMITQALEMVPLEVVVRNRVAGSLQKKFNLIEGHPIEPALVEFYFKKDELNDPFLSEDHILMLKILNPEQITKLKNYAKEVNHFLKKFFDSIKIILVDFKVEFGMNSSGDLILADEISPDSCRLWDSVTLEKMDKDVFRQDLGDIHEAYKKVYERIKKQYGEMI